MTALQFALGLGRLAGIVVPVCVVAALPRRRYLAVSGSLGLLLDTVLALSVLLVVAEMLGLVGLMRPAALIPMLVLLAVAVWRLTGCRTAASAAARPDARRPRLGDVTTLSALVAATDAARAPGQPLASALRVLALQESRSG